MKDFISANQASKVIGCNPQKVRMKMKNGKWDIGRYEPKEDGSYDSYLISKIKLARFIGVDLAEIERRLQ